MKVKQRTQTNNSINNLKRTIMKKNINNAVTKAKENQKKVNETVKSAKTQVKNLLTNAFVGVNFFNKVVSGKIGAGLLPEGLNINSIKETAKLLKEIHGGRYAFTVDILHKDRYNRFCSVSFCGRVPSHNYDMIDITKAGRFSYWRPISEGMPFTQFFNLFADYVKADAAAKVAKAKADAAAAKVAANKKQMHDVVFAVFGELANTFTDAQIEEKYNIIKAA